MCARNRSRWCRHPWREGAVTRFCFLCSCQRASEILPDLGADSRLWPRWRSERREGGDWSRCVLPAEGAGGRTWIRTRNLVLIRDAL